MLDTDWRTAAVGRWYDAQEHVGQADCNPEPYIETAAAAAIRTVLEYLRDDEGAWLTGEGAQRVDRLLAVLRYA